MFEYEDQLDPVEQSKKVGRAFAAARHEAEKRGIKPFLFHASSPDEFDARLEMSGVDATLEEITNQYLTEISDGKQKLAKSLKKEFEVEASKKKKKHKKEKKDDDKDEKEEKGEKDDDKDDDDKKFPWDKKKEKEASLKVGNGYSVPVPSGVSRICQIGGCGADATGIAVVGDAQRGVPHCSEHERLAINGATPGNNETTEAAQTAIDTMDVATGKKTAKKALCPDCQGEGTQDSFEGGFTAQDVDEWYGPDSDEFYEDYSRGMYDKRCDTCKGEKVVPGCREDGCTEPAAGYPGAHNACYEHMDDDEKEDVDSYHDSLAEEAAERRMGA